MTERGFATSGAYLVIGVAVFIALGTLYSTASNTAERVTEAQEDAREYRDAVGESAVRVADAVWDSGSQDLTVRVNNTGGATLSVEDTDVLVDGRLVPLSAFEGVTVDGRSSPTKWRPGEQLVLVDEDAVSAPDRVKVVGEHGIADTAEVRG